MFKPGRTDVVLDDPPSLHRRLDLHILLVALLLERLEPVIALLQERLQPPHFDEEGLPDLGRELDVVRAVLRGGVPGAAGLGRVSGVGRVGGRGGGGVVGEGVRARRGGEVGVGRLAREGGRTRSVVHRTGAVSALGLFVRDGRNAARSRRADDLVQVRVGTFPPGEFFLEHAERFLRFLADLAFIAARLAGAVVGRAVAGRARGDRGGIAVRDLCDLADARLELLLLREESLAELTGELDLFGLGAEVRLETVEQSRGRQVGRGRTRARRRRLRAARRRVRRVRVRVEERVNRPGRRGRSRHDVGHSRCLYWS